MTCPSGTQRDNQRGSALLVVLVFSAIVAIGLYRELSIYAFEVQRQKEELLIDRGNEYKHAVRLFVRKFGTYPGSLDALENTNNIRCLRRRYTDPFTHSPDWRLLHAGPGGVPVDSKVKPNLNGDTANADESDSSGEQPEAGAIVRRSPARAPAVSSGGGASQPTTASDPTSSLLPTGQAAQLTDNSPAAVDSKATQDSSQPGPLGGSFGGGIDGVASNAPGHSIRLLNKQDEYALWEFYYNPLTDRGLNPFPVQMPNPQGINGTSAPGTVSAPPTPTP